MTCALAGTLLLSCAADPAEKEPIATVEPAVVVESPVGPPATAAVEPPLLSWSFEPASADCNGWKVLGADAIRATPPRSGTYSCKVCATGAAPDLHIEHSLGAVGVGRYRMTAWVRRRSQTAAPGEATATLDADTGSGTRVASAPVVVVGDDWGRLETTIDLTDGATALRVTIGSPAAEAERCLFVDDVSVFRVD